MGDTADPPACTRTGTFISSVLHGGGAPVFAVHLVPPGGRGRQGCALHPFPPYACLCVCALTIHALLMHSRPWSRKLQGTHTRGSRSHCHAGRRREDKVELATAADPNAVWQKVWDEQQAALLAVRATAAAAKVQEEQGVQQQLQRQSTEPSEQPWTTPGPSTYQGVVAEQPPQGAGAGGSSSIPASSAEALAAALAQLPLAQRWLVKVWRREGDGKAGQAAVAGPRQCF